jgi:hypothetical protein
MFCCDPGTPVTFAGPANVDSANSRGWNKYFHAVPSHADQHPVDVTNAITLGRSPTGKASLAASRDALSANLPITFESADDANADIDAGTSTGSVTCAYLSPPHGVVI